MTSHTRNIGISIAAVAIFGAAISAPLLAQRGGGAAPGGAQGGGRGNAGPLRTSRDF